MIKKFGYLLFGFLLAIPIAALALQALDLSNGNTGVVDAVTFTPSPTCGDATIGTNNAVTNAVGKLQWFKVDITITNVGTTCSGNVIQFTLPTATNGSAIAIGAAVSGFSVSCRSAGSATTANCSKFDGSLNWLVNQEFVIEGWYRSM